MLPGFPLENQRTATAQPFPAISLNSGPNPAGFQVLGTTSNAVPSVSDPRFIDSKYKYFFIFLFCADLLDV